MWIIYGLHEAGKPEDIQYVGCTDRTFSVRLANHWHAAKKAKLPVHKWLLESQAKGLIIAGQILQQAESKREALELEWEWIVRYTKQGKLLLNVASNPRIAYPDPRYFGTKSNALLNGLRGWKKRI